MFDINYKTLFLIDHCLQFNQSSGISLEIDTGRPPSSSSSSSKQHQSSNYFSFIPSINKSLWTVSVETILEYSRIVWDVFNDDRLIRFLVLNDDDVIAMNSWKDHQNIGAISDVFAQVGSPGTGISSAQIGLQKAINALSELTEEQAKVAVTNKSAGKVTNRGRIIYITSCVEETRHEEIFVDILTAHNRTAANSEQIMPIHDVDFILISLHPIGRERAAVVLPKPLHDLTPTIHSLTLTVNPNNFCDHLVELCTLHHDLVITTVTGIPMKEEQNAHSSSNYDVPLFHPRLPTTSNETMILKWSSPVNPKLGLGTSYPCASACRVTPVDIISRPSTCLTNFVSSGRSVWLETPKRGKTSASTSHVLTPHGTEIWMHVMETSRNILEDPPSISEGLGGRVTDYRIPDFVEFMKLNMLVPYVQPIPSTIIKHGRKKSIDEKLQPKPNVLAKERLKRKTEYWPLTISGSLLFPMAVHLEPLLRLMPKDNLDEMEKVECDQTIWALMSIEARGDPPPIQSPHHKKGHKRDEQWKSVYNEIEKFLQANLHSPAHEKVLHCFQASRRQENGKSSGGISSTNLDQILDEVSKVTTPTLSTLSKSSIIADSPMSPTTSPTSDKAPPSFPTKSSLLGKDESSSSSGGGTKLNLLDLWKARTTKPDFRALPAHIKLYPAIEAKMMMKDEPPPSKIAKLAS